MFTDLLSALVALLAAETYQPAACQQSPPKYGDVTSDVDMPVPISEALDFAIDPRAFFDQLVLRYRGLTAYRDVTRVIQITQYSDDAVPRAIETEVETAIEHDTVSIDTPGAQLRRGLGIAIPLRASEEMESARQRYELWLLPHLTLMFADEPLKDFREGVPEGFTATEAASVTMDDRQMVHLELKSGDGLSEDADARFDLYVDPDSMLIERIQGEQRLPDGGHYETTLEIEPRYVEARSSETVRPNQVNSEPDSKPATINPAVGEFGSSTSDDAGEQTTTPSAWPDVPPADVPLSGDSSSTCTKDKSGNAEKNSDDRADAPPVEEDCPPRPNLPRTGGDSCDKNDEDTAREPRHPRSCADRSH